MLGEQCSSCKGHSQHCTCASQQHSRQMLAGLLMMPGHVALADQQSMIGPQALLQESCKRTRLQ